MRPVERMIAVTDGRIITGVGISGLPRPDVRNVYKEVSNPNVGWRVYLQGTQNFAAVKIYGVVDGGKTVCLVKPAFPVVK